MPKYFILSMLKKNEKIVTTKWLPSATHFSYLITDENTYNVFQINIYFFLKQHATTIITLRNNI